MATESQPSLEERIAALEALVHRQREELAALREQARADVRTPFRVVDDAGRVVLEVVKGEAGARLRLLDNGRFLVTIASVASGGSLAVHGHGGMELVALAAGAHGGTLGVSSAEGKLGAWMNVTNSGGHFVARDPEGNITTLLPDGSAEGRPTSECP